MIRGITRQFVVFWLVGLVWLPASVAADVKIERATLKNGLIVQVVSRPALPILTISMGLEVGSRDDPKGQAGLASITANLLTEGTTHRSANELSEAVEFMGARLSASASSDYTTVSITALSRDQKTVMELLADVVRHPAFDKAEVARIKNEVVAGLTAEKDQPGQVASKAFAAALFGDHPYGQPASGTEESVAALTRQAIVDFHGQYYLPNRAVLNFVGDIRLKQAKKLAKKWFKGWQPSPGKRAEVPLPTAPEGISLVTIDRPISQANVVMGHLGLSRSNPDFYPVTVMNYILGGGGFSSRLVHRVRDQQGLAYSVYSGYRPQVDTGSFSVRFQTKNENTRQAVTSVLAEIRRMLSEPVSAQELEEAKSYLVGSFPLRLDTNGKMANLLTFIHMYRLGDGYFDDYLARIDAVTGEDVLRVAKQYLHPDNMVWVVVGQQDKAAIQVPSSGE